MCGFWAFVLSIVWPLGYSPALQGVEGSGKTAFPGRTARPARPKGPVHVLGYGRHRRTPMRRKQIALTLAASLVAVTTLSGCQTWSTMVNYVRADSASVCPDVVILANTSVLPAFDPQAGADPANVAYTVTFTGLRSRCSFNKRSNRVDSNIHLQFKATRPSGGEAVHYRVPFYIAVTVNGEIVDKQIHWLEFDFDRAQTLVQGDQLVDSIVIDVARDKHSIDYHLLTGFQLTQAQLDYNKRMGQYLP
jgi:hypothetical protein